MRQNWVVDPQHSLVGFKVKHLAIASVSGTFRIFSGGVQSDGDDFDNAEIHFEMATQSIDTNHPERDKNLRSDLFLKSEQFPTISLCGFLRKNKDGYQLDGEIVLLGVTKRITLDVEYAGIGTGFRNDIRAGFEVTGKINRKDFGMDIHVANEAGDIVVGTDVKLQCNIELIKTTG